MSGPGKGAFRTAGLRAAHRLQMAAFRALRLVLRAMPLPLAVRLGELAGALYGRLSPRRMGIALANLESAFAQGLDAPERRRIARRVFRHFGRAAFEMITMDRYRAGQIGALFQFEGLEHARAAYARRRGVFLFTAHFGNWELAGLMQSYAGLPLAVVTRPLDNPLIEEFFRRLREGSGNQVISKRSAVRQILRAVADEKGVAIVIDQNVRSGARVFVDYFGRAAATTPTLALLALKTGAPVLPAFSFPLPGGGYRFVYHPPIEIPLTGNRDEDVLRLTQAYTRVIEEQVRAHPEIWLWMHERWKSRPKRGESFAGGVLPPP